MTPYQTYPQASGVAPLQPYQQYAQQNALPDNQYQVQNFDQSGYPQTGLAGSEQALQGGLAGALTGLQYGTGLAQGALQDYGQQGLNSIYGGLNQAQGYGAAQLGQLGQTQADINRMMTTAGNQITYGGRQARGLYDQGLGQLQQAGNQAGQYLNQGANQASIATMQGMGALGQAGAQAGQYLNQGAGSLISTAGLGANELNMARDRAGQYLNQGSSSLGQAQTQGLGAINSAYDQGVSALSQFIQPGMNAYNLQADLSGANSPERQAQAFANYQEGPEQAYLREQGLRAVTQNARAAGGVGGNVLKELQRQGIGMAAQDYQNSFNRLAGLSGQGLNAASGVGQLRGSQGQAAGSLISNIGQAQAQLSGQGASLEGQLGQAGANLQSNLGQALAGLSGQGAG